MNNFYKQDLQKLKSLKGNAVLDSLLIDYIKKSLKAEESDLKSFYQYDEITTNRLIEVAFCEAFISVDDVIDFVNNLLNDSSSILWAVQDTSKKNYVQRLLLSILENQSRILSREEFLETLVHLEKGIINFLDKYNGKTTEEIIEEALSELDYVVYDEENDKFYWIDIDE